jgi:shikimate 5-dehydrogenase
LSGAALRLGLVGQGIGHSLSPRLHRRLLQCAGIQGEYLLFDLHDCAGPLDLVRRGELDGLNVTTPFKREAAAACSPALAFPVNTLRAVGGALQGWSSDGPGFVDAASALCGDLRGARVLLLGTGGAAESLLPSLVQAGADVRLWGRNHQSAQELAVRGGCLLWAEAPGEMPQLVVHASRWGHGQAGAPPLSEAQAWRSFPWAAWSAAGTTVIDLVYSAAGPTWFEALAMDCQVRVAAGFGRAMLAAQAARSFGWWSGTAVPWQEIASEINAPVGK